MLFLGKTVVADLKEGSVSPACLLEEGLSPSGCWALELPTCSPPGVHHTQLALFGSFLNRLQQESLSAHLTGAWKGCNSEQTSSRV